LSTTKFKFGDRVVHSRRPEWGPGTITRAESAFHDGKPVQRLHIRFSGAGLKVLNTAVAPLRHADEVENKLDRPAADHEPPVPVVSHDRSRQAVSPGSQNGTKRPAASGPSTKSGESGWLGQLERRSPEEIMLDIPEPATDPFSSIWDRLQASIDLYRFTRSPRGILDWAIAQSGLEDPLSRFNRQELESLFERWTRKRDLHLFAVLEDAEKTDQDRTRDMLGTAPAEAQQAMRRLYARR